MKDFANFNRLSSRCLEMLSAVSQIHEIAKKLQVSPSQEDVDQIPTLISKLEEANSDISSCLMSFLQEIASDDVTETDAKQTDLGYKL